MLAACPVHPKGIMVIPMLWRIHGYVVCVLGVKNPKLHIPPYHTAVPIRTARPYMPPLISKLNTALTIVLRDPPRVTAVAGRVRYAARPLSPMSERPFRSQHEPS